MTPAPTDERATPIVDGLIEAYMKRYRGDTSQYYREVHQGLAPLAREMESWLYTIKASRALAAIHETAKDLEP